MSRDVFFPVFLLVTGARIGGIPVLGPMALKYLPLTTDCTYIAVGST